MKNETKNKIAFGLSRLIVNALRNGRTALGPGRSDSITAAAATWPSSPSGRARQACQAPRSIWKPIQAR
jgi:hypothetical protein